MKAAREDCQAKIQQLQVDNTAAREAHQQRMGELKEELAQTRQEVQAKQAEIQKLNEEIKTTEAEVSSAESEVLLTD